MANKLFEIEVQELLCRVIRIKAKSYNAALEVIQEKYRKCEIVLDYNDFVEVNYQDINKQSADNERKLLILELIDYLYDDEERQFLELDKISHKDHIFPKIQRLKSICREIE